MENVQKKPEIIVFAGPNGSGKSTFTEILRPPQMDYISADKIFIHNKRADREGRFHGLPCFIQQREESQISLRKWIAWMMPASSMSKVSSAALSSNAYVQAVSPSSFVSEKEGSPYISSMSS